MIIVIVVCVIGIFVSFFIGMNARKSFFEKHIGSAEEEAIKIVQQAQNKADDIIKQANADKKEIILEGKEEIHRQRQKNDKELSDRQKDIRRQENRLQQKEETIDKKIANLEKREENFIQKNQQLDEQFKETEKIKEEQLKKLQEISGLTLEQAKEYLLTRLDEELVYEKSVRIIEAEQKIKEEADAKAQKILVLAMQKCAAEQVCEATISVVQLPNDEMKGRIIGREGRNIRAIESNTGVDLIIDDTPETITLSCFDPVRREIARIAMERLIADGRIHPAKIEEMVEKARNDVELNMKKEGERAVLQVGVAGMHPELIKILGRLMFRTSYGQNVLNHSVEVAHLSGAIAAELGVSVKLAKRAGLLHDIGKALDYEVDGSHIDIGVELAKKYKENNVVVHAIHSHHGDVEAESVIDYIVQSADAISAARPGARKENLENYIKRLKDLEELASSFEGVERSFAIQAGREIRVMVRPDAVKDEKMIPLAREICKKIESDLEYPGQVKVNIIRENRAIEYAR
ncbi:MAG: ribonuclease Y [Clostridia bacterium]|nr:ribonuclease Y [Clostridia bacterium]